MPIAFLGTGLMGAPMALRLLQSGHPVIAWNRTMAKLEPLVEQGIGVAGSPRAAVQASEAVMLMLSNAQAIQETLLNPAIDALQGRTVIQMGTIAPAESQAIAAQIQAAGGEYLEATVLGSIPEARAGTLIVMVGATPTQFEQWLPLLKCFGPEPQLIGPVGAGATLKLAMNQLIGTLTAAFSMSLGLVQQAGIDVETFMALLRQSAVYAPTFDKKLSRMRERDFAHPNFPTQHLLKDMALFVQAAQRQGMQAGVADSVCQVVQQAVEQGLAAADYSAIFTAINPD
jgi:3-hydroxyisobutyrate dehydrogenase